MFEACTSQAKMAKCDSSKTHKKSNPLKSSLIG